MGSVFILVWKARVFETSTDRDNFPAGAASYKPSGESRGFIVEKKLK